MFSSWEKFNKIKIKAGVNLSEFKFYMDSLRTAYNNAVKEYMLKFKDLKVATDLAKLDFDEDIKALTNGEILFDSKVPGFRRY